MAESDTQVQPAAEETAAKVELAKPETNGHSNGIDTPPVAKPEVNGETPEEPSKPECPAVNGPQEHNGTPTASPCHTAGPQLGVDTVGWLKAQKEKSLVKVAYVVIEWLYKTTKGDISKVPGAKRQSTTKEEFLGATKDGILLAQLANSLKAGSIATVNEDPADKEKIKANIDGFIQFAKTEAELSDEKLFDPQGLMDETLQLDTLLVSLVELALMAQSKWSVDGLTVEQLQKAAVRKGSMKERLVKPFKKMGDSLGAVFRRTNSAGSPEKKRADKTAAPAENGHDDTTVQPTVVAPAEGPADSTQIPDIDVAVNNGTEAAVAAQ